jgi:hypothetical protein
MARSVVGIETIASVEGGSADSGPHGVLVTPTRDIVLVSCV